MAPEVLQCKEYNELCDMWSTGVILYLLLVGSPPFYGKNREETIKKISEGKLEFKGPFRISICRIEPVWTRISQEGKEFIKHLLQYAPEDRPSAHAALRDPWLMKFNGAPSQVEGDLLESVQNLLAFRTQMTMQKAVLAYIASQELTKAEEEKMKTAFEKIDTNKDGTITKDELMQAYVVAYGNELQAKEAAERIMMRIDLNQNEAIDYNGTQDGNSRG